MYINNWYLFKFLFNYLIIIGVIFIWYVYMYIENFNINILIVFIKLFKSYKVLFIGE